MRVLVVSNCQGEGLASCMRVMNPELTVDYFIVSLFQDGIKDLVATINDYDLVFAQKNVSSLIPDSYAFKVIYFPVIAFSAYHPDMTYVRASKKSTGLAEAVNSFMWSYHSSLIVYCYLKNKTLEETFDLFNEDVFRKLGYLNNWESSVDALIEEAESVSFPIEKYIDGWAKRACFMHTFNHPDIFVMQDIAIELFLKAGLSVLNYNPARLVKDPAHDLPIWPIYPGIANTFGLKGDYAFKSYAPNGVMGLKQFIYDSFNAFSNYEFSSIEPSSFTVESFDRMLEKPARSLTKNPYSDIEDYQLWKRAVSNPKIEDVDPVSRTGIEIFENTKIATAGSCFAQHISRMLSNNNFNYFVAELANASLDLENAHRRNFGVFSARYGNVYTARQLLQLVKRTTGVFKPVDDFWIRDDGKLVDPFRPQIEPDGFDDVVSLTESRRVHFLAVEKMLKEMDVFVFTLGLTEGWLSKIDGAVFPLAPGVAGGEIDFERYEFINFSVAEVVADMKEFLDILKDINPDCKVILTVSPVPLIATYEKEHALVATTYSKSVLRAAATEITRSYSHVDYFPSYEIITGSFNRGAYFDKDLRTVKEEGVGHVMRLFAKHYMKVEKISSNAISQKTNSKKSGLFDIVCDEEAITRSNNSLRSN